MRLHLILAVLALGVTSADAVEPARGQFNIRTQIGVAEVDNEGEGCLTIMNPALKGNETFNLVFLHQPQKVVKAQINNKTPHNCSKNSDVLPDASFYRFKIKRSEVRDMTHAIAVTGFNGTFSVVKGKVRADLEGNGKLESFRLCTSNEGLHLTIWAGEALISKRLWHEYSYLGYDVQPNCTNEDYEQ